MGVRPAGKGTSFYVPLRIWQSYSSWIDGCHRKASRDYIASWKELVARKIVRQNPLKSSTELFSAFGV